MARANRHFIPGYVWHITHRCHKQEFLLKFDKDRQRWIYWLFEAKKRYGLCILNFTVTSNHIHLLVLDRGKDAIPKSMQLIAGRTAQEYNQRKKRKGAFWEDRYHATAIDTEKYFSRCIAYIDLNMVRAGVVSHPSQWTFGGYREIQNPPNRYRLIDLKTLMKLCGSSSIEQLQTTHRNWILDGLNSNHLNRESCWTESIAVGSECYIDATKTLLDDRAAGREVIDQDGQYALKETHAPYRPVFKAKKFTLRPKNMYCWDNNQTNTVS